MRADLQSHSWYEENKLRLALRKTSECKFQTTARDRGMAWSGPFQKGLYWGWKLREGIRVGYVRSDYWEDTPRGWRGQKANDDALQIVGIRVVIQDQRTEEKKTQGVFIHTFVISIAFPHFLLCSERDTEGFQKDLSWKRALRPVLTPRHIVLYDISRARLIHSFCQFNLFL